MTEASISLGDRAGLRDPSVRARPASQTPKDSRSQNSLPGTVLVDYKFSWLWRGMAPQDDQDLISRRTLLAAGVGEGY